MEGARARLAHAAALIVHLWSGLDIAVQNQWVAQIQRTHETDLPA
jgi:hypothetical protein